MILFKICHINTFNIWKCISDLTDRSKDVLLFCIVGWLCWQYRSRHTFLLSSHSSFCNPKREPFFVPTPKAFHSVPFIYVSSDLRISSQGFRLWKYNNSAIKRFYERHYAMLKSCDILSKVPPERKDNKKNSAEMLHFCSIYSKGLLATYLLALKANVFNALLQIVACLSIFRND